MRKSPGRALAALLASMVVSGLAAAAGWGGITAGVTTREEVETLFGRPTRQRVVAEEGQTGTEWTYVGERAPRGLERLVVGFGLLGPDGFAPDLVRSLTLYPKPRVFTAEMIGQGWGKPDAIGTEEQTGRPAMRYDQEGLLVVMDPTAQWAEVLVLAPGKSARKP